MNSRVGFWGLCFGLLLIGIFVCLKLLKRQKPALDKIVTLLISGLGTVSGGYFCYVALFMNLGPLEDQRVAMVVGAIAMVYISVETIYKVFKEDQSKVGR
ncbi:hypothetical protein HYR99_10615 [Candidatus Poribacteria bacterium]|nr:hypothetical protein [Candidatus Poribacteria bacterium]